MSKFLSILNLILGLLAITVLSTIFAASILTVGIDQATVISGLVLVVVWLILVRLCPKDSNKIVKEN